MKRAILTAVTATAIALSPAAVAPARAADAHDIIGAFLGIAAIAAIANSVKSGSTTATRTHPTRRTYYDTHRRQPYRPTQTQRPKANVLPGQCLRVIDGRRSDGIVFPETCLQRNGVAQKHLPKRCETQLRTRSGRQNVYRARCLADAGWSLPRIRQR